MFFTEDKKTIIQQRVGSGIWKGLYEFPLIESDTSDAIDVDAIASHAVFREMIKDKEYEIIPHQQEAIVHKLSHQHLYTRFYIVKSDMPSKINQDQKIVDYEEIHTYPVPILLGNFIDAFFQQN